MIEVHGLVGGYSLQVTNLSNDKTRGRVGGYGRTGRFLAIAEYNKWYDSALIMELLNAAGDNAKYSNAKAVFEALERGKCHLTKRRRQTKKRLKKPQIMLLKPVHKIRDVPGELRDACDVSIKEYLTTFMLTSHVGAKMKGIRREYHKNDKNLLAIASQQRDKIAINFDDTYYYIAAWEMLGDTVRVLFNEVPAAKLTRGANGKHYFRK